MPLIGNPRRRVFVTWGWVGAALAWFVVLERYVGGLVVATSPSHRWLGLALLVLLVAAMFVVVRQLVQGWAVSAPGRVSAAGIGRRVPVRRVALVPVRGRAGHEMPVVQDADDVWHPVEALSAPAGSRRHALFVHSLGGTRGLVQLVHRSEVQPVAAQLQLGVPRRWWHRAQVAPAGDPRWQG